MYTYTCASYKCDRRIQLTECQSLTSSTALNTVTAWYTFVHMNYVLLISSTDEDGGHIKRECAAHAFTRFNGHFWKLKWVFTGRMTFLSPNHSVTTPIAVCHLHSSKIMWKEGTNPAGSWSLSLDVVCCAERPPVAPENTVVKSHHHCMSQL